MFKEFLRNLTNDVKIQLSQEFDRNFERKAFFNKKWPQTKLKNSRGSMMIRSGAGRRSIKSQASNGEIKWSSNLPYMSLHNEGGEIVVTQKMKSFFWAMFYKANGASNIYSVKTKKKVNNKRSQKLDSEAAQWKALALQKVGAVMTVEQRQFIGWHPQVDLHIRKVIGVNLKELNAKITNKLKS
ncbi:MULTISPECIES: hypothetical protein [Bizionia]|uniref:Phage morphogenesis protein n=1 Tax=Bizionia algoritergicola TaxID=291187 RepID=A0A5D0R0S5_9FLAO|nr:MULTISPECIES: hypothetical protein [Bizionia]OBX20972.1 hypothetical protein BAA08_14645 [Bizionia sp. APA-3]TYB74575.1 hypothetical protein ES675_00075 [Bizionia algoritergicola]